MPPTDRAKTTVSGWSWAVVATVLGGVLLAPLATTWKLAPDLGHSWAAPLLMAYLWWERWSERPP